LYVQEFWPSFFLSGDHLVISSPSQLFKAAITILKEDFYIAIFNEDIKKRFFMAQFIQLLLVSPPIKMILQQGCQSDQFYEELIFFSVLLQFFGGKFAAVFI
jgi:hypothetical protein